tara:strand:+ start:7359 stop:8102 length:744 start_codon:yes stop_codon:yes gene_type:complete
MIKQLIKKLLPTFVISLINRCINFFYFIINWNPWANYSYSQEGEDILLNKIFNKKKKGFYIDIGAHHPKRFSNSYLFYKKDWQGINIDCMPGSMKIFKKFRPRDINLEIGIAENEGTNDYHVFNETALNSFSKKHSQELNQGDNPYFIKEIIKVKVMPLSKILDIYLKKKEIDFLDVDVEGMDLSVLRSNDWSRYRPKFVLVEILENNFNQVEESLINKFMKSQNYNIFAKLDNTVFFKDQFCDFKY